jgi:hexosaminidase
MIRLLWILLLCCEGMAFAQKDRVLAIIPQPTRMEIKEGNFKITSATLLYAPGLQQMDAAIAFFNQKLKKANGFELKKTSDKAKAGIVVEAVTDKELGEEGYVIDVTPKGIVIKSNASKGVFYAFETILQMLPPEIEKANSNVSLEVAGVSITDVPRFKYRGMHLDVGRHFKSKEFVKTYIEMIARYKMNVFEWHLTEDQGWRIEIKKYPKLTEMGAWRDSTVIGHAAKPRGYKKERHGGFYTQEDVKEIVQFAAEHFVTVMPEIEMPGHATAATYAYPEYCCSGKVAGVIGNWGVFPDVFCAGNEKTYTFIEDILNEVLVLFPSSMIHIGGDECPKDAWKTCPKCQAKIKAEGLKDEAELQTYFTNRMEKFLTSKGRITVGWDEILEGGKLSPSAVVMSWRGEAGGVQAAKLKHQVVMAPTSVAYFDTYQESIDVAPLAIANYITLQHVYDYNPIPKELSAEEAGYVLGFQANLWTEYIPTEKHAEYMVFPRMCALAEVNWTPKEKKDFVNFEKRVEVELKRLDYLGINHAKITQRSKDDDKITYDNNYWYRKDDKSREGKPLILPK